MLDPFRTNIMVSKVDDMSWCQKTIGKCQRTIGECQRTMVLVNNNLLRVQNTIAQSLTIFGKRIEF